MKKDEKGDGSLFAKTTPIPFFQPVCGEPSDGDDDLDRTGLGVDHLTIDDHPDVIDLLQSRLRQRIQP